MKQRSRKIIQWLVERGCREFIVCAGARNAPLVLELYGLADSNEVKVWPFFEERSAAFFALGRIKATDRPVAVLTTSGTAAAELLPAIIESHYTAKPMIAVTADRPRRYRNCGAPQTINQVGLYSHYVQHTVDFEQDQDLIVPDWDQRSPLHLNVCFEEPKPVEMVREIWQVPLAPIPPPKKASPSPLEIEAVQRFQGQSKVPVVVVGSLEHGQVNLVKQELLRLARPIYLESLSGLTGDTDLFPLRIWGGERCVAMGLERQWIDGVIRVGGVPTARVWRDLEGKFVSTPVLNVTDWQFSGLSRTDVEIVGFAALEKLEFGPSTATENWREIQISVAQKVENLFAKYPRSEPALLATLAHQLPHEARVYLGNSLPIREWESARGRREQAWWMEGNRGVNGIDGQVSTFLGFADEKSSNWAVLGDLTTMYDLAGPWVASQREFQDLNIVVINNGGGRIFTRMYGREELENNHHVEFSGWAKMWRLKYEHWLEVPPKIGQGGRGRVIELQPDVQQTEDFWRSWEGVWREFSTPS